MNNFADRLREALSMKGISQAELSRRTGIGRNSISDYLKAKYEAKQDNLLLLANALDVNEAWLMGLDVEMEKSDITSIYDQLTPDRKTKVVNFANYLLSDQRNSKNKKRSITEYTNRSTPYGRMVAEPEVQYGVSDTSETSNEYETLAAHRIDEKKVSSPEEIDDLKKFLDDLIEKENKKHKD